MEPTNDELVAEMQQELMQTLLPVTIYVGIETVLGFFGNILIIYVFAFRYHVCNFRYFVLGMAILDFTSCLTTMPGEIITQTHWYTYSWDMNMICKVKSFFNIFTATGVAFSLLTIAVDRYRKVCRPLGWQIKPRLAIGLCITVYLVAFVISVPCAVLWGVQTDLKTYKNRTVVFTKCETDDAYKDTETPHNYTIGISVVLSISLCCMFVLYIFVARKLFRDKRKYYGASTKMATFMNSTYLAGASSDVLESSTTKGESSDSGPARAKPPTPKRTGFNLEVEDDNTTTDSFAHSQDSDFPKEKSEKPRQKRTKRKKRKRRTIKSLDRREMAARVRRKTLIMFVLTIVFIITTVMYVTLLSFIAEGILPTFTNTETAVYFFFFRFYFINHVINPLIYGIMDPHFRQALMSRFSNANTSVSSGRHR